MDGSCVFIIPIYDSALTGSEENQTSNRVIRMSRCKTVPDLESETVESIRELLLCSICSQSAQQPKMCPNCSKLLCGPCIQGQKVGKEVKCPLCCRLTEICMMVVDCTLLVKKLSSAFTGMGQKENLPVLCQQHGMPLEYFCNDCHRTVCSDCVVIPATHRQHNLIKLTRQRSKAITRAKLLMEKIAKAKSNLLQKRSKVINTNQVLADGQNSINIHANKLLTHINDKFSTLIKARQAPINRLQRQLQHKNAEYDKLYDQIVKSGKASLIKRYLELKQKIMLKLNNQNTKSSLNLPDLDSLDSHLTPSYDSKTFILNNYQYLREKGQMISSQPFYLRGIDWRLMIFPNGKKGEEGHLSVFAEMRNGNPGNYYCKIEIVNQVDKFLRIFRQFEGEFESEKYCGYDRFVEISTLYDDKFVTKEDDTLEIVLSIRTPTYYHATKAQNFKISEKQSIIAKNQELIHFYKKQVKQSKKCLLQTPVLLSEQIEQLDENQYQNQEPEVVSKEFPIEEVVQSETKQQKPILISIKCIQSVSSDKKLEQIQENLPIEEKIIGVAAIISSEKKIQESNTPNKVGQPIQLQKIRRVYIPTKTNSSSIIRVKGTIQKVEQSLQRVVTARKVCIKANTSMNSRNLLDSPGHITNHFAVQNTGSRLRTYQLKSLSHKTLKKLN